MSALVERLRSHGERVAVLTDTAQLTYRELADRIDEAAHALGDARRLVLLETRNDISTLVHYLGALAARHGVLPVPAGRDHAALDEIYAPDVVIDDRGVHHRHHDARPLHDDLSLLMSTSGSTGSPKLVRLSHANLIANATVIAEYLGIGETDRAATTLPMSYCYGLSVIHSHLLVGAGLILTDLSVVDEQFWKLFRRHSGTSFAGVPYTFELLERIGFDAADLSHLRYVTQAGGRMPPERVRRFAELAQRSGFDLFVMYGATEATARMAYLPSELALSHPNAIGRPIRGGSFSIEPLDGWDDDDVGELVYRGPNVMMGYAHGPDDLALGKTVETLRTGDIARRAPDGLFEVVGRNSRFVKMYGLRIDLQQVETALRAQGMHAFCTNDDDRLVVAVAGRHDDRDVQRAAADAAGVPAGAVRAVTVDELPLLSSGKPDYQTVRRLARTADQPPSSDLLGLFADVLQVDAASIDRDASFVDLGGNSLSYVTMTVRLERAIGQLPADWQQMPIRQLECISKPARRSWLATLETSVALRAAAIVLIVGSHAELFELWGGAHLLLGIAGYNFGRFCLTPVTRTDRVRHLGNTDRLDRTAVVVVDHDCAAAHRRLHVDESAVGQQVSRSARQHDRGPVVVRRSPRLDTRGAGVGVLVAADGPPGASSSVHSRGRVPRHRSGAALRHSRPEPGPRCMVHDAGLLVLRDRLGGIEGVDDATTHRGDRRLDRQPARLFRQHPARGLGDGRPRPAHLGADDPVPVHADGDRGGAGGGVVVHLPRPLPGLRDVRRPSSPRRHRLTGRRGPAHVSRDRAAPMAARPVRRLQFRPRFPLCDKAFLRERGRDGPVGTDQAGGHDPSPPRGGG